MTNVPEDRKILTVTEDGKGRLTETDHYRVQRRGGLGIRNYNLKKNSTHVVGVKAVTEEDDAIMISQSGIIIRFHVSDLRTQSRYGSGVRVMRIGEDDAVVTFARAERSDEEEAVRIEDTGEDADLSSEEIAELERREREEEADEPEVPDDDEPESDGASGEDGEGADTDGEEDGE